MKILIPTYLYVELVAPLIEEIRAHTPDAEVFASCRQASASVNRNACLDQLAIGEVAVMLDDDVSGFYPGWLDDLLRGLEIPNAVMVSARLLNPDGSFAQTCSRCYAPTPDEIEVFSNGTAILPTAAIAFKHSGIRFDPAYIGSGFEDSDWCQQIHADDPTAKFIQSNRARLCHLNRMTNQKGRFWDHNRQLFRKKWSGQEAKAMC
jgi:hypothetical protein